MQFISTPFCDQCAHPFPFGENIVLKCGSCLQESPLYQQTRASFKYDAHAKKLVLSFKHGDAIHLTPLLGQWMYKAGTDLFPHTDCIVPVPLHWTRLLKRGYNQAELLAKEISKHTNFPLYNTVLKRSKATASQGHLSAAEREKNVKNAFKIQPKNGMLIRSKNVLLIDDVMASGTTLHYCTKALLKAGARQVNILVLAKRTKG
jgi:ComF family protein